MPYPNCSLYKFRVTLAFWSFLLNLLECVSKNYSRPTQTLIKTQKNLVSVRLSGCPRPEQRSLSNSQRVESGLLSVFIAHEFFKWLGKETKEQYFVTCKHYMKFKFGHINKVSVELSCAHLFMDYDRPRSQQSWVTATETLWTAKPAIFIICLLQEKVANPGLGLHITLPTNVVLANSLSCSTVYQPNTPHALFCHPMNAKLSFDDSKAAILIQQRGRATSPFFCYCCHRVLVQ